MPIRSQLLLSILTFIAFLAAFIVIGWKAYQGSRYHLQRIELASQQLIILSTVSEKVQLLSNVANVRSEILSGLDELLKLEDGLKRKNIKDIGPAFTKIRKLKPKILSKKTGLLDPSNQKHLTHIKETLLPQMQNIIIRLRSDRYTEVSAARNDAAADMKYYGIIGLYATFGALIAFFVFILFLYGSFIKPIRKLTKNLSEKDNNERSFQSISPEAKKLIEIIDNLTEALKLNTKDRKALEELLENEISYRTEALAKANEKLTKLDTMRAQFLTDISHEIRTPLTAIKGEAQICLRKRKNEESEYRATLSRIDSLSNNIEMLVEDLIFLARSETDTIYFEFKTIDLQSLVASVVDSFNVFATEKYVDIKIHWPSDPIELNVDALRIKQALGIVLDNALKYARRYTEVIILIEDGVEAVIISVQNQGTPIPPEDLPYIFERFYRGKKTKELFGSGLGLGLSIAKWIINKHEGSIHIDSTKDGITIAKIGLIKRV